jgi:hypothetical protein
MNREPVQAHSLLSILSRWHTLICSACRDTPKRIVQVAMLIDWREVVGL